MSKSVKQAGDTIIEVLISITVIGLALAGAYASVNHSLIDVRDAQEHEEALNIAASQLEIMNSHTTSQLTGYITTYGSYCFDTSQVPAVAVAANTAHCQNLGNELFNITITSSLSATAPDLQTYKVNITWPGLNGGTDNVQAYYQPLGDS